LFSPNIILLINSVMNSNLRQTNAVKIFTKTMNPVHDVKENETNLINIIVFLPIYFCYQIT